MKNIHVLPTDKPSKFYNTNTGEYHFREYYVPDTILTCKNHNIYITSDEEIKEGDWVITPTNDIIQWAKVFQPYGKKIILTTDQDLFNEGVQPIDDEFLEWFVKNPSCEEVKIENGWGLDIDIETPYHKIIIPKEEQTTEEQLPTKWFKTEEMETWVGTSDDGGRGKLIVLHQCGENKEELISQLKTLISGIDSDFEFFAQ
jgi:hypothetical protein